jgi:hypothetical protein
MTTKSWGGLSLCCRLPGCIAAGAAEFVFSAGGGFVSITETAGALLCPTARSIGVPNKASKPSAIVLCQTSLL